MKKQKAPVPLAYRFGGAFFCELPFYVSRHTLIPRFDTEKLAETVILNTPIKERRVTVLDLCTGSGCVAVVLALHGFDVTAADISRKALRVAKRNAKLHGVCVRFVRSDLFKNLKGTRHARGEKFGVIVCNPPYIKTAELGKWDKGTLAEPRLALDGGADGLDFYRRISAQAGEHLTAGGRIYFEIDRSQTKDVESILLGQGFCDIKIYKDAQGFDRVISGAYGNCESFDGKVYGGLKTAGN